MPQSEDLLSKDRSASLVKQIFFIFPKVWGSSTKMSSHPFIVLEDKSQRSFITYDGVCDAPLHIS